MLIEAGADVEATNADGLTPLHCCFLASPTPVKAAVDDDSAPVLDLVTVLLDAGASASTPRPDGTTPLMSAARANAQPVAAALIDAGADVNAARPADGLTALHAAAANGAIAAAMQLVAAGVDTSARNVRGQTFVEVATAEFATAFATPGSTSEASTDVGVAAGGSGGTAVGKPGGNTTMIYVAIGCVVAVAAFVGGYLFWTKRK